MSNRKYWEDKLIRDGEKWLIYDKYWLNYWNYKDNNISIFFYENRGFIIIIKRMKCIQFAYVCSEYRRIGILKKMVNHLLSKYNELLLYSLNEQTDKIWNKFNCKFIKERKKENETSTFIITK